MANNKLHGYTPKIEKFENGNRLDQVNPYEFRTGMDYELVELGCSRLAESTPEERMNSTEKVLKNLTEHPGYYSGIIHYNTQFRNESKKPSFKTWLSKWKDETEMKPVPVSGKNKLKEAIKSQIKKSLLEKKSFPDLTGDGEITYADVLKGRGVFEQDDEFDLDFDKDDVNPDLGADRMAHKAGTKKGKGVKSLEKEADKLEKEKDGLKDKMFPLMQAFKAKKKGKRKYTKEDYERDLAKIKTSTSSPVTSDEVKNDKTKNDHVTDRIKAINARVEEIDVELEDLIIKEKMDKREVAATMMDRQTHKDLLGIIKECGVGMNEGAETIKPYYEVAKMAYMEGLTAGIRQY
tara:strand:+ start:94 stop:1140 length:1047 start_codon:yes stop_codon:yes gene_type:complete